MKKTNITVDQNKLHWTTVMSKNFVIGQEHPKHLVRMNFPTLHYISLIWYGFRQFFACLICPEWKVIAGTERFLMDEVHRMRDELGKNTRAMNRGIAKKQKKINELKKQIRKMSEH